MSCKGLTGRALAKCKLKAGKIKRDSIKVDRIFRNTVYKNPKGRIDNPFVTTKDNSPKGKARGQQFKKDNDFQGWEKMKKLEKQQNIANNTGRPTQRTPSQKKELTKAWNFTNVYEAKNKVRNSIPLGRTQF